MFALLPWNHDAAFSKPGWSNVDVVRAVPVQVISVAVAHGNIHMHHEVSAVECERVWGDASARLFPQFIYIYIYSWSIYKKDAFFFFFGGNTEHLKQNNCKTHLRVIHGSGDQKGRPREQQALVRASF